MTNSTSADAVGGELDFEREARRRIEGPELALVVDLARSATARNRSDGRATPRRESACANPRSPASSTPGARLHREERGLAASGARRAQQAVARENGVERAHEDRLDVHAGEIEIARVGAGFMAGDFAEAGQPQRGAAGRRSRRAGCASSGSRPSRVGRDLHRRRRARRSCWRWRAGDRRNRRRDSRRRGAPARSRSTTAPRRPR